MRVLLVHEYYQQRGGEDIAFETDAELLHSAGHEVACLPFHNSEIGSPASLQDRLQLLKTTLWSAPASRAVASKIAEFQPDVVHFHNTFPLVSPAAFHTARKANTAVVATLHNYRLVCANASLYRDGRICDDCLHMPAPVSGVLHGCYRQSRSQSAAVATMLLFHRLRNTWRKDVHQFISPSRFLRSKLIEGGMPAESIAVRPNAVRDPGGVIAALSPRLAPDDSYVVYVGRLSPNKGIETLLQAWSTDPSLPCLRIIGGGELAPSVTERAQALGGRVSYMGQMEYAEVLQQIAGAKALVFPSLWYENQPMTILEAFACGVPVIASRLGAISELVADGQTGLTFEPGDPADLAEKVRWAIANSHDLTRMGKLARVFYEAHASPESSMASLLGVYRTALQISAGESRQWAPA